MVSPEHKQLVAVSIIDASLCSLHRAWHNLWLSRSSDFYRPRARADYEEQSLELIKELSNESVTYGYALSTEALAKTTQNL